MATELKILKFEAKHKKSRSDKRNIYAEKYPFAKDFVWAVMNAYSLSLRDIAIFATDGRRKLTDKEFNRFVNVVYRAETYSEDFRKYRRKILVRCNGIDLEATKMKEEDKNTYEIELKGLA